MFSTQCSAEHYAQPCAVIEHNSQQLITNQPILVYPSPIQIHTHIMQYFNQLFEVSEEEIRRVEEDYSFLFPEPYRLFLSHNISKNQMIFPKFNFEIEVSENKFIQAEMSFYVMVNGIPIWISGFFDFDSIKYFLNEMKKSKNWEKYNKNKMLIIAETGNGNSWCIGIGKSNYGKVFLRILILFL